MTRYVIWDWNGTLLDDTAAALETLNDMLAKRGSPEIGMEFYRDNFRFPVKPFYEKIGVVLEGEDWDALAREYHDVYAAKEKRLAADAKEAVIEVRRRGAGESIVSALRQDLLERDTERFGIRRDMDWLFGVDNLDGLSKTDRAKEALSTICGKKGVSPDETVLVGDSLHDAEVASAIGVRCILYGGGSHSPARLAAAGPVAATLMDAVRLAF